LACGYADEPDKGCNRSECANTKGLRRSTFPGVHFLSSLGIPGTPIPLGSSAGSTKLHASIIEKRLGPKILAKEKL
jgi:hypothetical protein